MGKPNYIKKADGKFAGSVGDGINAPTPALTAVTPDTSSTTPDVDAAALLQRLQALPGITVHDMGDDWEEQVDPARDRYLLDSRKAADEGRFGPGAGHNYMTDGRCGRCDSRYCYQGCYAGEPGYVYCVGKGYITFDAADAIEAAWEAQGLTRGVDFGPTHGMRRIEWAA